MLTRLAGPSVVVLLVLTLILSSPPLSRASVSTAVVISKSVPVYSEPAEGARILKVLPRGTEVSFSTSRDGFFAVELSSGETGWLPEVSAGLKVKRGGKVCVEVGLQQAIDEGLIEADFKGAGGYFGESLSLYAELKAELGVALCPTVRRAFVVAPPPSSGDRYQRMIVRSVRAPRSAGTPGAQLGPEVEASAGLSGEAGMMLGGDAPASGVFPVEAYCMDADKAAPREGMSLTPSPTASALDLTGFPDLSEDELLIASWASMTLDEGAPASLLCLELSGLSEGDLRELDIALGSRIDLQGILVRCEGGT